MGTCEYVLAEDCVGGRAKEFAVLVKNIDCGGFWFRRGASCTKSVTVLLAGDKIEMTRDPNAVVINNVKVSRFPVVKLGKKKEQLSFKLSTLHSYLVLHGNVRN